MKLSRKNIKIAVVMGSNTDYAIMKEAEKILKNLNINFDTKIISAHRTPLRMYEFAKTAHKKYKVIIAGGGAAPCRYDFLSYKLTSYRRTCRDEKLKRFNSLLSVVQIPKGVVTATVAINNAMNAGLLAAQIVALLNGEIKKSRKI